MPEFHFHCECRLVMYVVGLLVLSTPSLWKYRALFRSEAVTLSGPVRFR